MCTASPECGAKGACVAGRCQLEKATLKPAIENARRLVLRPKDIGYTTKQDPDGDGLPSIVVLGGGGEKLFLRFSVALPPATNVVEAYVVLRRSSVVDDDPTPISLYANRIVEPWTGGLVAWGRQPRLVDTRSPRTTVEPNTSSLVRVDVRELVRGWARHEPTDQGIALVSDAPSGSKATFAMSGLGLETRAGSAGASDPEPYLELYVR